MQKQEQQFLHTLFIKEHHLQSQLSKYKIQFQALNKQLVQSNQASQIKQSTLLATVDKLSNQILQLQTSIYQANKKLELKQMQIKTAKNQIEFLSNRFIQKSKKQDIQLTQIKQKYVIQKQSLYNSIQQLKSKLNIPQQKSILQQLNREQLIDELTKVNYQNDYLKSQITTLQKKIDIQAKVIDRQKMDLQISRQTQQQMALRGVNMQQIIKNQRNKIAKYETKTKSKSFVISNKQFIQDEKKIRQNRQPKITNSTNQIFKQNSQQLSLKQELQTVKKQLQFAKKIQNMTQQKYYSLASILSSYLNGLIQNQPYSSQSLILEPTHLQINLEQLRNTPVQSWSTSQKQVTVNLLLNQIRPFITKSSLLSIPQPRNINMMIVDQPAKQIINLPKVINQQEKKGQKLNKLGMKFRNIPADISTQIVRSQVRQWGRKKQISQRK